MNGNETNSAESALKSFAAIKPCKYSGSSWAKRLLIRNPFYPASSARLLLVSNRLAVDTHFLANDQPPKLFFNFSALQVYGILLLVVGWQDEEYTGASSLRTIPAVTWIVHAIAWTHVDGTISGLVVPSIAVVVLVVCGLAWLVTGRWKTLIMPAGAVLSFLAAPVNFGIEKQSFSDRTRHDGPRRPVRLGKRFGFGERSWHGGNSAKAKRRRFLGDAEGGRVFGEHWLDC